MKNDKYSQIVRKLGFEPKNYIPDLSDTENDNYVNPFSVLSIEELHFLQNNNYFRDYVMEI